MKSPLSIAKGHFSRELQNRDEFSIDPHAFLSARAISVWGRVGGSVCRVSADPPSTHLDGWGVPGEVFMMMHMQMHTDAVRTRTVFDIRTDGTAHTTARHISDRSKVIHGRTPARGGLYS